MPVTKQTYTTPGTWTASQLANTFRSAFIDAGLMTEWFDSFANSGVENRIMELTYDAVATYGKTYLWLKFTTAGPHARMATGWDAVGHVPLGTVYEDYYNTTTTLSSDEKLTYLHGNSVAASSSYDLVRFTSGDISWFQIRHQTYRMAFCVPKPGVTLSPIAAALTNFAAMPPLVVSGAPGSSQLSFLQGPTARRAMLNVSINSSTAYWYLRPDQYPMVSLFGHSSHLNGASTAPMVPFINNKVFVLHSHPMSTLCDLSSADFGIVSIPNISHAPGDEFTVNGTEVWEAIAGAYGMSPNLGQIALVARTA